MSLIITLFLLIGGAIFFSIIFNKKIEETIILNFFILICVCYFFGFMDKLKLGIYIYAFISIVMWISSIILFILKDRKKIISNIWTPGFFIFCFFISFLYVLLRGRMFIEWDEFSHWGSVVKSMFITNRLSVNPESSLMFKSYPPAMSIFEYFFMVIKNQYCEYLAFYSYNLFGTALFLPFVKNLQWKKEDALKIVLYSIVLVCAPMIYFSNYYASIYIDAILGLTFGFIMLKIITIKTKYEIYDIILISLGMFVLVLQKDVGLFLAFIAIITNIINILFLKDKKIKDLNKKEIMKIIGFIIIPILSIFIAKISWSYLIKINNVEVMFSNKYELKGIIKILLGIDDTYRENVLINFKEVLYNKKVYNGIVGLTTIHITIIIIIVMIGLSKIFKTNKRENATLIALFCGWIIYLFGLLLTYCFKFSEAEALACASIERYVGIYINSMIFIIVSFIIYKNNLIMKNIIIFTCIILLISPLNYIINPRAEIRKTIEKRVSYMDEIEKIRSKIGNDCKGLYIISIISDKTEYPGLKYFIMRYELIPIEFNYDEAYSITSNKERASSELVYMPYEKFKDIIFNKYDYVYINEVDENFKKEYGELFNNDVNNNCLYKVQGDNLVNLYK